ncbi:hypothetical protein FXF51_01985 [Nonomuraea sp. PA05]|uniref:hypothetical protein n=1 Tax=Nonomuraea sp. PA05 TaxID=2604466 RepID=UPI0011D52ED9|nr:hypothetical protein [Nonomuraea sp. PA05]TYB71230.1 hypothetical protein FXF51_01985 [Nonomuraea sp. PA05]
MRIHVLRLPLYELGGVSEEPFALIVNQAPPEGDGWSMPALAVFAEQIDARGVWVTAHTVEIVDQFPPEIVDHVPMGGPAETVDGP